MVRSLRCRVLVCSAADTASLATRFLFGRLFCVAITFGFSEKRCRKNLPLSAPSFMLSGFSHVRYDHSSRPRVYDVACPKCAARASAHKDSETEMGNVIGDLAGTWHLDDWRITCLSCDYRESDAAYAQLPPPFFRVTSRGTNLWAFNRGHFVMLLRLLDGDPISGDPYEWFATYAHGDWLRKSNRVGLAKQMRRLLESQPATGG